MNHFLPFGLALYWEHGLVVSFLVARICMMLAFLSLTIYLLRPKRRVVVLPFWLHSQMLMFSLSGAASWAMSAINIFYTDYWPELLLLGFHCAMMMILALSIGLMRWQQ
jgi:hypothetical protein